MQSIHLRCSVLPLLLLVAVFAPADAIDIINIAGLSTRLVWCCLGTVANRARPALRGSDGAVADRVLAPVPAVQMKRSQSFPCLATLSLQKCCPEIRGRKREVRRRDIHS